MFPSNFGKIDWQNSIAYPERLKWWQVKPTFDFGHHCTCPYIWFGWWLITWETYPNGIKIDIEYLPD